MNEALFRRNAAACENAKHSTCHCACNGALHGKRHGEDWIRSRLEAPEPDQARAKLTVVELDAEFGTDNAGAIEALQVFRDALKKSFGGGS